MIKVNKKASNTYNTIKVNIELESDSDKKIVICPEDESYDVDIEPVNTAKDYGVETLTTMLDVNIPYRVEDGPIEWITHRVLAPVDYADESWLVLDIYFNEELVFNDVCPRADIEYGAYRKDPRYDTTASYFKAKKED